MNIHEKYELIRQALAAGDEAMVEVTALRGGEMVVDWGVAEVAMLRVTPNNARLLANTVRGVPGYGRLAEMLIEAATYCDRRGARLQ